MSIRVPSRCIAIAATAVMIATPLTAQEKVDTATIARIRTLAMDSSQVMTIASWMTDVYGPNLTWSPNVKKAGEWVMATMKSYGLANVHAEPWYVPNALSWANERFSFMAISPNPFIIEAVPRAWSVSSKLAFVGKGKAPLHPPAKVSGPAVRVQVDCFAELKEKFAGKLANAFILPTAAVDVPVTEFNAYAARLSDSALYNLAFPGGGRGGRGGAGGRGGTPLTPPVLSPICQQAAAAAPPPVAPPAGAAGGRGGFGGGRFNLASDTTALRWMQAQGVGAILMGGRGGNYVGGAIATDNGASRVKGAPQVPYVHVATESYGRIARMLEKNVPVVLELDMQNTFYPADTTSFNYIGEIPGADPALKDEVVIIGGHFDSWHSGTGATDNAAGSAVMMEAMRILKALNLQPRRTIRIGLWTGEEQGLYGSREYTALHYGTLAEPRPEHEKLAAYFNVDNGGGKIRGIYLQGMEAERPIFDAWMTPFKAMGMKTITISNTGGTDHLNFVGVGLPGFQFIQDGLDYSGRTHHVNQDVYERLQPDDMKFNAMVAASFAWQAAQRDEKLPHPLPVPAGAGRGGRGGGM